jgi:hypothetical protein
VLAAEAMNKPPTATTISCFRNLVSMIAPSSAFLPLPIAYRLLPVAFLPIA